MSRQQGLRMVTRLTRLVGLLGRGLDNVDYDCITALVGNSEAAESEDLDYKRSHYATDDKGREELAKDVAAFANHTGGLLILGMAENKGVPSMAFDVDLDDTHLRRIRQTIANNTAPPVSYEPIPVPNPSSPNVGFLLLAVPRSPYGPHAVTAPPPNRPGILCAIPGAAAARPSGSPRRMSPRPTGPVSRRPLSATSAWPMSKRMLSVLWCDAPRRI